MLLLNVLINCGQESLNLILVIEQQQWLSSYFTREFPVKSTTFVATHAYVGSYYIKENLKEKMEEFHPLPTLQPNDEYNIEFHNGWYYQKGVASHPDVSIL